MLVPPPRRPDVVLVEDGARRLEEASGVGDRSVEALDGDPDVGKSTLTVDITARLTTGRPLPGDESACLPASPVVLMAAEDGLSDTIRPRLDAAGADTSKVHHFDAVARVDDDSNVHWQPPTIPDDVTALEELILDTGAVLVVVDVLMAFLSGRADSHRDQDVRRALAELADVADRTGACIILLRHLRKSRGQAMYAGGGSIGIIGVARAGLVAAVDPDDETGLRRVLAVVKSNLSVKPSALAYTLVGDEATGAARVEWLGESPHTADTLLRVPSLPAGSRVDQAAEWLGDALAGGPVRWSTLKRHAEAAGFDKNALHRARDKWGAAVVIERDESVRGRPSTWRLDYVSSESETKPVRHNRQPADQGQQAEREGYVSNSMSETKPETRYCAADGCGLSATDNDDYCWVHTLDENGR